MVMNKVNDLHFVLQLTCPFESYISLCMITKLVKK